MEQVEGKAWRPLGLDTLGSLDPTLWSALQAETNKNLLTSSKCEGPGGPASGVIGSFIGMGMVGFCFGIGLILAVKTVNNLEYCIEEFISRK